jgi:sugar lactone lactonase YvrE
LVSLRQDLEDVMRNFELISDVPCQVGESATWDAEAKRFLWADIPAGIIYELDWASRERTQYQLPEAVGSFGLADDGRLVVGLVSGVHLYDRASGRLELLVDPEPEQAPNRPQHRLNDGKVGPDGAFWVGSMHTQSMTATLYRITGDGRAERKVEGLGTSNGLAFSADGHTLFHSDSKQQWIDRWTLDPATGNISNRTRIATPGDTDGRPDGAATDVEGCYWSAGVSAGCLNRYDRDGRLLERIAVPQRAPTMPCFGGPDMKTLFLTSLRRGEASPDCGKVFAMRVEVAGVGVGRFVTRRC